MFYGKNPHAVRMETKPVKNFANILGEWVLKNKYKGNHSAIPLVVPCLSV